MFWKRAIDFATFSNVYVALPVSCLAIVSFLIFEQPVNWLVIGFVYFSTLFLYSTHRLIGLGKIEKPTYSARHVWAQENKIALQFIIFFSGILAGIFTLLLPFNIYVLLFPLSILALGYTIPWLKNNDSLMRLRDIPFIKIYLIAIVVSAVTVVVPGYFSAVFFVEIVQLFIIQGLFVLAITIPFDIRDYEVDALQDLKTIPLVFGVSNSKYIAVGLLLLSGIGVYLFLDAIFLIPLFITLFIASVGIVFSTKSRSEYYFSFLIEGMMLLQLLLLYFFKE